jgi:hypothetical protein
VSLTMSMFLLCMTVRTCGPGPTPVSPGVASTSAPAVERVDLEVDYRPLLEHQVGDAAEDSAFFVREDATRALAEQHGVQVVDDASAASIVVRLAWKDYDDSVYRIEIATRQPGRDEEILEVFEATCINSTALSRAVVERLPAALGQLGEAEPVAMVGEPAEAREPEGEVAEPQSDTIAENPVRPLKPLGRAGIGVAVVGAGALVSGGVVYSLKQRFDEPSGGALDRDGQSFEPPGIALMVSGGAALVAGAVLLIVDRTQARRAASARLLPSPRGLVLTGRF